MKWRVLIKTTSFHAFTKKKGGDETVPFWGGTVSSSSSPGRAAGEEKVSFSSPWLFLPTCSIQPKPDATCTSSWWESREVVPCKRRHHWPPQLAPQQCRRRAPHAWAAMGRGRVDPAPPAPINTTRTQEKKKREKKRQQTGRETNREREKPTETVETKKNRGYRHGDWERQSGRRKKKDRKDKTGGERGHRSISLHSGSPAAVTGFHRHRHRAQSPAPSSAQPSRIITSGKFPSPPHAVH